jgi:hypothetical protein
VHLFTHPTMASLSPAPAVERASLANPTYPSLRNSQRISSGQPGFVATTHRLLGESSESRCAPKLRPYTVRMDISLTFSDLAKLAANGKVEKDGNTLSVSRPILPAVSVSPDGLWGFVRFTVDESAPPSKVVPMVRSRRPRPWPES